jgi:hypothetical protein
MLWYAFMRGSREWFMLLRQAGRFILVETPCHLHADKAADIVRQCFQTHALGFTGAQVFSRQPMVEVV